MITQELLNYIKQQQQQGISQEEIKNTLLTEGWQEKDIKEAFDSIKKLEKLKSYSETKTTSLQPDSSSVKISKKPIRLIVLIILSVIIGAGIFGYFYFRALERCPERITQRMFEKMSEIRSLEYTGQIIKKTKIERPFPLEDNNFQQLDESSPIEAPSKFLIDFKGAVDIHDPKNPRGWFRFGLGADILPQRFGLEARFIKDIIYLKLSNIPDLGFFDLTFLEEQWVEINIEMIREQLRRFDFKIQPKGIQEKQGLSPEQIEQIKQAFIRAEIFKTIEELPSEKINGIDVHRYKFILNREEIIQLVIEINEITKQFLGEGLGEEELQLLKNSLQRIEAAEGEFWIGKKDFLLYKFLLDLNIREIEEIRITVQFKNHNKPVQINIPMPVKTIEEIFTELLGGLSDLIEDLPLELLDLIEDLPLEDLFMLRREDIGLLPPIEDLPIQDLPEPRRILTNFCRKAINMTQLKEITGKENFVFKDIEEPMPEIGILKICKIQLTTQELIEGRIIEEDKIIEIGFFPKDVAFETLKQKLIEHMLPDMEIKMEIKEVEDVGEKAFSISWKFPPILDFLEQLDLPKQIEGIEDLMFEDIIFPEIHQITFLDADINQVIGIMVEGFSYQVLINLAKQIEKNLR